MFPPDTEDAVERFATQESMSREEALAHLVRDWLIGQGFLEPADIDGTDDDD